MKNIVQVNLKEELFANPTEHSVKKKHNMTFITLPVWHLSGLAVKTHSTLTTALFKQ